MWNYGTEIYDVALNTETAIAATTYYPASGSFIDLADVGRACFRIQVGALTTALTFQVRQDTSATATGSIKDVTGATVTVAATDDNKVFTIEFSTELLDTANGFRYVSLYATGAAGGDDYAAVSFMGLRPRHMPVTQPAAYPAANRVIL